jgi:hypothetical protein
MTANLQQHNLQYDRMEQDWERDHAEAQELRRRDLLEAQAALEAARIQRDEDIAAAQALRVWNIEEAAFTDLDSSRAREAQLRQENRATPGFVLAEILQTPASMAAHH